MCWQCQLLNYQLLLATVMCCVSGWHFSPRSYSRPSVIYSEHFSSRNHFLTLCFHKLIFILCRDTLVIIKIVSKSVAAATV